MSKLSGKVAVVTGASKGIGAEIAKQFGTQGASVVVNYSSSKEGADKVVEEIVSGGGKAVAVQGDVSKREDIERIFAETKTAFGPVNVLVNNAGVFQFDPLDQITENEFHRQFNTNVLGIILATQEAAKQFGENGGSVINIGSVVSRTSVPNSAVYTATKHAVNGLTKSLAAELGAKKIRVNSINPGGVDTEGSRKLGIKDSDFGNQMIASTPLGRLGEPGDIAPVASFLASDDSSWVTGEILSVSGGL